MSNTGQIKRYNHVGYDYDDIEPDDNGEFVKYDDHLNIVNDLEIRIDDLKRGLDKIFAAEQRIAELEKELNDTKYLLSISSNMIRALNATE